MSEEEIDEEYGHTEKIVKFTDTDKRYAELRLRLHYDGMSQGDFFRAMVTGYIQSHPDIVSYIEIVKNHGKNHPQWKKRKVAAAYAARAEMEKKFGLNKEDIESIFDLIEKEYDTI
tara:strand:- start:371 stop:718 length:348 start_codon:yes stop_codon:yes gene_type:complete